MVKRLLLAVVAVHLGGSVAWADHFESRRRDAARRAELREEYRANRRPWGGPTTGRQWWTPERNTTYNVGPYGNAYGYVVPGQYQWMYGRLVYVPPTYLGYPYGSSIHIERRIYRNR